MNLYYMILVDGIKRMQSVPANKGTWKPQIMIFTSMAMALNIGMIMSIIQLHILGHTFYDIKFDIFPGEKLNNALSFFILYFLIPVVINYLCILRNNRYEKLLVKYKYYNGKLYMSYFFGSIIFSLIYGIFLTPTVK